MSDAKLDFNKMDSRAGRPDGQAFDEVRIFTVPRWKESELSGDEWRISGRIQFYLKGHLIGERSFRNVATALRYGDWATVDMFENHKPEPPKLPDVSAICDQEGCKEIATHRYRLVKRFRNDGSEKEMLWREHRCFCERHRTRGDCGLDDADANYELIETIP